MSLHDSWKAAVIQIAARLAPLRYVPVVPQRGSAAGKPTRLSRSDEFLSSTGRSSKMTMWWNWQTRDGQNVVPTAALGVRVSPWAHCITEGSRIRLAETVC